MVDGNRRIDFHREPDREGVEHFYRLDMLAKWNTVMKDVTSDNPHIAKDSRLRFYIRPLIIPVYFEPVIEEVAPHKKITWRGEIFGITAIHECNFQETAQGVLVTSQETFFGGPVALVGILFFSGRLKELTLTLLKDLKQAAENRKDNGTKD